MSEDNTSSQEPDTHEPDGQRQDAATPVSIATTDPCVAPAKEQPSDRMRHPDSTVSFETTQMGEPNPLYAAGMRSAVLEDRPRADKHDLGRHNADKKPADQGGHPHRDHGRNEPQAGQQARGRDNEGKLNGRPPDDHRDGQETNSGHARPEQPSMIKNLSTTAGVAIVCGVIAAAGYTHFFGPKSDDSSSSKNSADSKSAKTGAQKKKSSFSGTQSVGESNASGASLIPGFTASDDADTLKKQLAGLMQRVDGLTSRIDRLSRPQDVTPPVLHTMQIKMGELARVMDDVAMLPAKVRHLENTLETLQEDIKILRSRLETGADARERSTVNTALPRSASAPALPPKEHQNESPTMELGVTLLEQGQYASAREVFERLQMAQPLDARVWYFGAMAAGLVSGNWDGEAKPLVDRGIERERAGTPSTAQIDASLATRSPIKGAPWLSSLRQQAFNSHNSP